MVQDDIPKCSSIPLEDIILLEQEDSLALLECVSSCTGWEGNAALTNGQVLRASGLDIKLLKFPGQVTSFQQGQ